MRPTQTMKRALPRWASPLRINLLRRLAQNGPTESVDLAREFLNQNSSIAGLLRGGLKNQHVRLIEQTVGSWLTPLTHEAVVSAYHPGDYSGMWSAWRIFEITETGKVFLGEVEAIEEELGQRAA